MKRPNFLSNKRVICDFCELEFIGNLNKNNLIMCDKCIRNLCGWSDEEKIKILGRFKREKDKQKLIKHFINEEVLDGAETQNNTKHISRAYTNSGLWSSRAKDWQITGNIFLD